MGAAPRTVAGWKKSDPWKVEIDRLSRVEREATTELLLDYREQYVQEMLASRDVMRKTLNAQLQVAGQLAIAASRAAAALTADSSDPVTAALELSKGGVCHVAQTSATVSKTAQALLEAIYGISQVIRRMEEEDGDH